MTEYHWIGLLKPGTGRGWLVRLALGWRFLPGLDPLGSDHHARHAVRLWRPAEDA